MLSLSSRVSKNASGAELGDPDYSRLIVRGQPQISLFWQTFWKYRGKNEVIEELSKLLISQTLSKQTTRKAEFFLPQLIYMSIMLEPEWETHGIHRFLLNLAQNSLNSAVLMCLYLRSVADDLNPETPNGKPSGWTKGKNHANIANAYLRALKLIQSLERAVLLADHKLDKDVVTEKELERAYADKKINAAEFVESKRDLINRNSQIFLEWVDYRVFKGGLLHRRKRRGEKGPNPLRGIPWEDVYVEIKHGFMLVFDADTNDLIRSVPLLPHLRAASGYPGNELIVLSREHKKHEFLFELIDKNHEGRPEVLQFQAANATAKKRWIRALEKAIDVNSMAFYCTGLSTEKEAVEVFPTELEKKRLFCLRNQVKFIQSLFSINRGTEASEMNVELHEFAYMPLSYSSDEFIKLLEVNSDKTRVLAEGTEALITFKVEQLGTQGSLNDSFDVANVLHTAFSVASSTVGEAVSNVLAPLASRIWGKARADNMVTRRPSVWTPEDEAELFAEDGHLQAVKSYAPGAVKVVTNEVFLLAKASDPKIRDRVFATQVCEFSMEALPSQEIMPRLALLKQAPGGSHFGFQEVVSGALSLDGIKKLYLKKEQEEVSLLEHFRKTFAGDTVEVTSFLQAQDNFSKSCASLVILSHVLDLRLSDVGGILVCKDGSLVVPNLSSVFDDSHEAKLKFTKEMEDVLNYSFGSERNNFELFIESCVRGFLALRSNNDFHEMLANLVELMSTPLGKGVYCTGVKGLQGQKTIAVLKGLNSRLGLDVAKNEAVGKFLVAIEKMFSRKGQKLKQRFETRFQDHEI